VSRAFGYDAGEGFHMPRAMKRLFELTAPVQQLVHLHPADIFGALGCLLLPALAWTTIFTCVFETTT